MPSRLKSSVQMDRLDKEIMDELKSASTTDLLYLLYDVQSEILKILIKRQTKN